MTKVIFLSNNDVTDFKEAEIYITFSKIFYSKHKDNKNILYFFDIEPKINEKAINLLIEKNLFEESKINNNEFYPMSFKYIYKYYLTYTQFYNRICYIVQKYKNISEIQYSSNISFIFTRAVENISKNQSIDTNLINEKFDGFSYRHNETMLSDIPYKQDRHTFYIFLYAMYLRIINHKVFVLPSSFMTKCPTSVNFFKSSIFTVNEKFKQLFKLDKSSRYSINLAKLDFSKKVEYKYELDRNIWRDYRDDELKLIEHLINIFFELFTPNYLLSLKNKIRKLLRWSNTKCIILDETIDAYRRLISTACNDEKLEVEYLPHGIISEHLQFPFTSDKDYVKRYIPKTLAWNIYSSNYLEKMNLSSIPITFPINISPHQTIKDKDILVMLSYGDRVNLNQFEEDIVDILELLQNKEYKIDWKIHQNIFEDNNNIMNIQKTNIEKTLNVNLNFINHNVKSSSIMKNYKFIIFTTYTTGIYEAALLNIPFVIYSNETEDCNGLKISSVPIAKTKNDFKRMLEQNDTAYLDQIKKSLVENISLNKYLTNKCA